MGHGKSRRFQLGLPAALAAVFPLLHPPASGAAPPVTVTNSWFRYILPQVPAGGYMTLRNTSSRPLVMTAASSAACGAVMLHRTVKSGGMDRMVPVEKITVPAHGTFRFAPGGYHMMCMHPRMHAGQTVVVTLLFADGSRVQAPFAVHGVGGPPDSAPDAAPADGKMKMPM